MRSIALLFALIGITAAATIYGMDGRELQEAMMKEMLARQRRNPTTGLGPVMGHEGPGFETMSDAAEEEAAEREAREAEEGKVAAAEGNGHHPSSFTAMMGMMFPDMMFNAGTQHGDVPQFPQMGFNGNINEQPHSDGNEPQHVPANVNGHHLPANGNGHHAPANGNGYGHSRPVNGNGNSRPVNGSGNKRGNGAAAAASASSFSRGPNSFASSQAQAFGGGYGGNGNQ